jgi:hypothetical protein
MIRGYENGPGEHCGSTAMRNLINHYCGLDLSEAVIFGLGSGIDFLLLESAEFEPGVLVFGRSATLEPDVAAALGVDYREQPERDDARAWEQVRDEVARGRPTMLSGDIYHLDYRDFKVHFPGHRFVLLGFDDDRQVALVADHLDREPQACSYEALRLSRNPPDFISTQNLWGRFGETQVRHSLETAFETGIARSARRMLGREAGETLMPALPQSPAFRVARGLAGLAAFERQLPDWAARDDLEFVASYAWQCIEKFGTGGGNFRTLYAAFLCAVRAAVPDLVDAASPGLAAQASAQWTALAGALRELGQSRSREAMERGKRALAEIITLETRLFESLAARAAA